MINVYKAAILSAATLLLRSILIAISQQIFWLDASSIGVSGLENITWLNPYVLGPEIVLTIFYILVNDNGTLDERLLDIMGCFSACFIEYQIMLVRKFLALFGGNFPFKLEV